jgi:pimeloyl-ACP methyl ester carboxylesterase
MIESTISYTSSIDAHALDGYITYPFNGGTSMPLVVLMHSYSTDYSQFATATRKRFASTYGNAFVVMPNMRGRGTSEGSKDSGGREIQDIIDAIAYIKANYGSLIDEDQTHIVGHSGGGGNALSCAARFPDTFNSITSCYGISDYGHDVTDGWYQNASQAFKDVMDTQIGGSPVAVPDNYHARASVLAVANYTGGHLWLFADDEDAVVNVANSRRVDALGLSNCTYSETGVGDSPRWTHGVPNVGEADGIIQAEPTYMPPITSKTYPVWTVPASGTLAVVGWLTTKRFSIWVRANGSTPYGLDAAATVAYNTATDTYTVTPLSGAIDVSITQGAKTGSATNITEATEIVVA